jgi:hypothetical protein
MRQRERAEAAPPASPEQRALDCEIDRMMRELMFPRFIIPEREDAEARGVAWLKSCLSPEQLQDYDRSRSFVVIGEHTGNRYRICWGTSQNIIRLETSVDGREIPAERLCSALQTRTPLGGYRDVVGSHGARSGGDCCCVAGRV